MAEVTGDVERTAGTPEMLALPGCTFVVGIPETEENPGPGGAPPENPEEKAKGVDIAELPTNWLLAVGVPETTGPSGRIIVEVVPEINEDPYPRDTPADPGEKPRDGEMAALDAG